MQRVIIFAALALIFVTAGTLAIAAETPSTPQISTTEMAQAEAEKTASEAHDALFTESKFPSATTCGTCHPKQFEEWAVSQHSYSQLSPAYMALQNFINIQVNGANG
ncbi:MAG TPA: hypothetical protein ENI69_05395, partial [Rhodospirillales bacterium]|nr:hypothetical protein [Rhodospirillales bacterium]